MRRITPLAAALLFSLHAHAAPASAESIDRMLDLSHAERALEAVWPVLETQFRQAIAQTHGGKPVSTEQLAIDEGTVHRLLDMMHEQMGWQTMKPQYVKLYADTFTQEEIDGLNAFYGSPAGQAYVAKMPQLMQRIMPMMQAQMTAMMPRLMRIIVESGKASAEAAAPAASQAR